MRKADLTQRLTGDNDARGCGFELLNDAARAQLERQVASMTGNKLILPNLAIAADKHWAGKLPGMGGHQQPSSFKGFYAFLYRNYSGTAHPSFIGLNYVVEDVTETRKRVILEKAPQGRGPFGMATVVYALGLYVAAQSLGWPDAQRVDAAFERYPALV